MALCLMCRAGGKRDARCLVCMYEGADTQSTSVFNDMFGPDGATVIQSDATQLGIRALKNKHVLVFFGASQSEKSRALLAPLLRLYVRMQRRDDVDLEVVYVSLDRTKKSFVRCVINGEPQRCPLSALLFPHANADVCCGGRVDGCDREFASMPWLAFPHGDPRIEALCDRFRVTAWGLPRCVIMGPDGEMACEQAEGHILDDAEAQDFPWAAPSVRTVLRGVELMHHDGHKETWTQVAQRAKVVAIFFGGGWCGPCRGFTPSFATMYTNTRAAGKAFEVIYVSHDQSQQDFEEYWGHMPWLALPFKHEAQKGLGELMSYSGIPTVYLVEAASCKVITGEFRRTVMRDPLGEKFPWIDASGR